MPLSVGQVGTTLWLRAGRCRCAVGSRPCEQVSGWTPPLHQPQRDAGRLGGQLCPTVQVPAGVDTAPPTPPPLSAYS